MRTRARLGTALTAALVAAAPAAPASAQAAPGAAADRYSFTLRAGAVENFVYFFHEIAQGAGFSRVALTRAPHAPQGRARAVGAGYWTLLEDEPCLLGCDLPCTSPAVGNPTMARQTSPASCDDRTAGLSVAGSPPPAHAVATGRATGAAEGHVVDLGSAPGIRVGLAGSHVSARVGPDGVYTGIADAYVQNLVTATGWTIRSITSQMRVTARPDGTLPKVTFSFSVAGASGADARAGVDERNFSVFGKEIPLTDVVNYFNHQVANIVGIAGILGQAGVTLLEPEVGLSDDGSRYRMAAPVLLVGAGQGGVTQGLTLQSGGVRLATGVFEGSYAPPDPDPR